MLVKPLSLEDCETVRGWRNLAPETLRTAFPLNREQQEEYFHRVICDRNGNTRYYGFWVEPFEDKPETFVAYGGLENIIWPYRIAELSIIVNPDHRCKGMGRAVVNEILRIGFDDFGLSTIFGEVYLCANVSFWDKIIVEKKAYSTVLPRRKYFKGKLWDSLYFSFSKPEEVKE